MNQMKKNRVWRITSFIDFIRENDIIPDDWSDQDAYNLIYNMVQTEGPESALDIVDHFVQLQKNRLKKKEIMN